MTKKDKINKINPIARAMLQLRKHKQVVPNKVGKGSYDRKREKDDLRNAKLSED